VSVLGERRRSYRLEPRELWCALLFFALALFSVLWPNTGSLAIGGAILPRGYLVAAFLAASGLGVLLLGTRDFSTAPRLVRFVRCFYPQAYYAPLFLESIVLSGQAMGGRIHDPFFAGIDLAVFGFQPARELSAALGRYPWCNELAFAAYFLFYFMLILTPWIPFFRGDEAEAERESSIFSGFMLLSFVFYVFFRVVGPKHYLPDLAAAGYGWMRGGLFTRLEGGILSKAVTTGAAFPSSHVAISLMMCLFAARTERRLLWLYVPLFLLISASTVYIYAHWAVDVAGGVLVGLVLVPILSALHERLAGRSQAARA
jgi:membrane-associated phospholipid phosphatase